MQQLDHDGTLTLGHNVQIGYFAQNQASLLDGEITVYDTIDSVAKGEIRLKFAICSAPSCSAAKKERKR